MNFVTDPDDIEPWTFHKGATAKMLVNGQKMTAIMSMWEPKTSFPLHSHAHEQIGFCLQGEVVFIIDGKEYVVKKGKVYTIPPDVQHAQRNDSDEPAVFLECFAPVREDLLRGRFEQKVYE